MIVILVLLFLLLLLLLLFQLVKSPRKACPAKQYVFAYGSLLNPWFLRTVFPNRSKTKYMTAFLTADSGYIRYWLKLNEQNDIMLGLLRKGNKENKENKESTNGILIPVDDEDLRRLDQYERTHYRTRLDTQHLISEVCNIQDPNNVVFVYLPKPTGTSFEAIDVEKFMPDFYVVSVLDGFSQYGEKFLQKFKRSTYSCFGLSKSS